MKQKQIPQKVLRALKHVRKHYPQIVLVVYNEDLRWQFMDENFNAPKFGNEIDVSILDDAADSLEAWPAVYQISH